MKTLVGSVQTPRLKHAFDKYLAAVLNNGTEKKSTKATLTESVTEVTGNKSAKKEIDIEERDNVIDIKRLAGL